MTCDDEWYLTDRDRIKIPVLCDTYFTEVPMRVEPLWIMMTHSATVQSSPVHSHYPMILRWYFYIQQTDRLTYKRGGGNFRGSLSPGIVYQTDILYHSNIPSCHNMLHLLMSLNKKKKTLNGALKSPAIKWDVINQTPQLLLFMADEPSSRRSVKMATSLLKHKWKVYGWEDSFKTGLWCEVFGLGV